MGGSYASANWTEPSSLVMKPRRTVQTPRQPSFNAEGLLGVEAGGARRGHPNGEKGNQA